MSYLHKLPSTFKLCNLAFRLISCHIIQEVKDCKPAYYSGVQLAHYDSVIILYVCEIFFLLLKQYSTGHCETVEQCRSHSGKFHRLVFSSNEIFQFFLSFSFFFSSFGVFGFNEFDSFILLIELILNKTIKQTNV